MIDAIKHAERRNDLRRKSDRQFFVSISIMFALVFVLGASFGYYLGALRAIEIYNDNAVDTRGRPASHLSNHAE